MGKFYGMWKHLLKKETLLHSVKSLVHATHMYTYTHTQG